MPVLQRYCCIPNCRKLKFNQKPTKNQKGAIGGLLKRYTRVRPVTKKEALHSTGACKGLADTMSSIARRQELVSAKVMPPGACERPPRKARCSKTLDTSTGAQCCVGEGLKQTTERFHRKAQGLGDTIGGSGGLAGAQPYIHIYMYTCILIYTETYIRIYKYTSIQIYIHTYIHTNMYISM